MTDTTCWHEARFNHGGPGERAQARRNMRRFAVSDEPSTWSPSWQTRWGGSGGPTVILFAEPESPSLLSLRPVLARLARPKLALPGDGGDTARRSSVGR